MSALTRTKLLGIAAALGASLLMAGPAQASYGTVVAKLDSVAPGGDGGGVFNFTRTGGTFTQNLLPGPAGYFIGICLDTAEGITVGNTYTWDVDDVANAPIDNLPQMGATKAADIALLIGGVLGGQLANALAMTNAQATALQWAIWEIVNETTGTYGLDTGTWGRGSSALADGWLANLNGGNQAGWTPAKNLYALVNRSVQDFLVQTPIPAAAWLLGSGLLGLFGISRRRRQTVAA